MTKSVDKPGDPTRNVLKLVTEAIRRQDDLRRLEFKAMRRELHLETKSLHDEYKSFRGHLKGISKAETKRINAIRAVDVAAVATANAAAENRASTLAGQVNAAKDAQVVALKAETDPIRKDIGDLRQSQWTIAGGRQQGQIAEAEADTVIKNKGMWIGIGVAIFASFISATLTAISIAVVVYVNSR